MPFHLISYHLQYLQIESSYSPYNSAYKDTILSVKTPTQHQYILVQDWCSFMPRVNLDVNQNWLKRDIKDKNTAHFISGSYFQQFPNVQKHQTDMHMDMHTK